MTRIWTFGDSTGVFFSKNEPWAAEYIEWKGYEPKVYGEILSELLGYELKNKCINGACNSTIFQQFCKNVNEINPNDIVIFNWSDPQRFRLSDVNNKWRMCLPTSKTNLNNVNYVSNQTVEEIFVNRESFLFLEEISDWIKLINFSIPKNFIYHSSIFDSLCVLPEINSLQMLNRIVHETNYLIKEGHLGEKGHMELANTIHYVYMNKNKNRLV